MTAYLCHQCNTIHGWIDHPSVMKVTRHHRGSMEDIWYCPNCNKEHRTHDGTFLGQSQKHWERINNIDKYLRDQFEQMRMYGRAYFEMRARRG